jgi:hypothetical protein
MKRLSIALFAVAALGGAHAALVTKTISYRQGDTELKGYLAYDDSVTMDPKLRGFGFFQSGGV